MPSLDKIQRRALRCCILKALIAESGSSGTDNAELREVAQQFLRDCEGATTRVFEIVGGFTISGFYPDPNYPNANHRRSLWMAIKHCIDESNLMEFELGPDPGGWGRQSNILSLGSIAEDALSKR